MSKLSRDQLCGDACVVCGRKDRPLVPILVETAWSTMLFRCETCPCSDEEALELVAATEDGGRKTVERREDVTVVDAVRQSLRCTVCGDEVPMPLGVVPWVTGVMRAFAEAHPTEEHAAGRTLVRDETGTFVETEG